MAFSEAYIPYGGYWSTPFCRWQGSFANKLSIVFAAEIAKHVLDEHNIPSSEFDGIILGMTIPQKYCFYGAPWLAGMIGAMGITGPMVGQACATSANCVALATQGLETNSNKSVLGINYISITNFQKV